MRTLDEQLNEHYIHSDYALESFVENFYNNEDDKTKLIKLIKESNSVDFNKVINVVVVWPLKVSEKKNSNMPSITESVKAVFGKKAKVTFIEGDTLAFSLKNNEYKLYDAENYSATISVDDIKDTIVWVKYSEISDHTQFVLKLLQDAGFFVLNPPEKIIVANDKFLTAEVFTKNNIKQPKYCLVNYYDTAKNDVTLDEKLKAIYPKPDDNSKYVCKILGGHGGSGVFLCSGKNILSILQCLFSIDSNIEILVQEKLDFDDGDIRVHVLNINGKQRIFDCTMRTKSGKDFRTNLSLGNDCVEYKLSPEQKKLAIDAAKAVGLIWSGVDLVHTTDNKDYVIEINGCPGTSASGSDLKAENIKFYTKLLTNIKELCKQ